jgi:hypothetical protein
MSRSVARKATRRVSSIRYYSIVHDVPRVAATISQTPPPPPSHGQSVFDEAVNATAARNTWTKQEISQIHQKPLMELAFAAVCHYVEVLQAFGFC